ncbi:CD276 antigen [Danio aesculapii]|uniref:CD276 antigen n=1 Tax=Danio aesculapii TaxID=1142201 RepID=UPI0024C08CF4|nr:CD276 antigen [Danio aesculapii]
MTTAQSWTYLILVWIIADTNGKTPDVHVTCTFSEDCVLPCVFEAVGGETIYWFKQNVLIHTYKLESGLSDQHNSKTSLFTDMISSGNASLHVPKSGPQDRGKYRCVVSSRETSKHIIIVTVEAPITSVSLETTGLSGFEEVRCSSRNIYPAPRITLFTEPIAQPDALHPYTRKTADPRGLYTVESKLLKLEDLTYICLIQSFYRSQTWRTSLQEKEIFSVEGQDLIIPCVAPWSLQNFTVTWSFTREYKSSTFFTYDSLTQLSSSVWQEKVRLVIPGGAGGDGSLWLHSPLRMEHMGTYTCIISAPQTKHQVQTRLNIIPMTEKRLSKSANQWWIPATVITVTALAAIVIGIIKSKAGCSKSSQSHVEAAEMQPIRVNTVAETEDICLTEEITNRHT